jgi:hypothetical protein
MQLLTAERRQITTNRHIQTGLQIALAVKVGTHTMGESG